MGWRKVYCLVGGLDKCMADGMVVSWAGLLVVLMAVVTAAMLAAYLGWRKVA